MPCLPVIKKEEMSGFSQIMLNASMTRFDSNKMAEHFLSYVDGLKVYPKLPSQLREYYKSWERNKRIRKAEQKMKNDGELLQYFLDIIVLAV